MNTGKKKNPFLYLTINFFFQSDEKELLAAPMIKV